jgi:transposase-like protein
MNSTDKTREFLRSIGLPGGDAYDLPASEKRFADGRVCPICGGVHVQRNGRRANGSQKFVCKDCGKTFSIRKNTIFSGTHKSASVWKEFLRCMSEGLSLDKTAERCGITHATAFVWRHKVLDVIGDALKDTELTGIVEADEAFLPVSYKGVSTKYLNNYLTWNNVMGAARSLAEKATALMDIAVSALFSETSASIPDRPPLPILVKKQSKNKL